MSNFAFLRAEWPELFAEAARAERNGVADPRASCFYARRALELTVGWLYAADRTLQQPYRDDLAAQLFEPSFRRLVANDVQIKCDLIRRQGNVAVHRSRPVTANDSMPVLGQLFQVLYWLARNYSRDPANLPPASVQFDPRLVPRPASPQARMQRQAELAEREREQAGRDRQLAAEREANAALQAELAELRKQVAVAKAANEARPDEHDYNEEQTRDLFIDVLLKEAGWALDRPEDREYEVTGMPNPQGKGYVDYVLWGADGKPLAVVEAKRTRRNAKAGEQQAKLYADCLERQFGQRPVIFYTNGYEHWIWDDTAYPPRAVEGFYTRDELELLVQRRTTRKRLADLPINGHIVERHYQHRAIRRIGETFEDDRQRQALVVMATGAGKTRMVIALVDLLMRAGWVKRVLFLADRVALVNQTVNAFKAHLPDATTVNLVSEKTADGRVYVSTYPTMMGLINEGAGDVRRFGPGFFDLVIIDEAHRSVYRKYRAIFSWFDSLLVGLTATPKDFRGKAQVEQLLGDLGVSYAVVRPAILFGGDGVLINNIAWLLRHLPVFAIGGRGDYRVRGIHVDDLARLCVDLGARTDTVVVDAVGPQSLTFRDIVEAVRAAVDSRAVVVPVPAPVLTALSAALSLALRDRLLTREEYQAMAAGLADSDAPATGAIAFTDWLAEHGPELGRRYANELDRHFRGLDTSAVSAS